jgi:hypothetical protein
MASAGSQIVLHRSKVYRDRLRKYKVLIDGEVAGRIAAGEVKAFPVTAGEHRLELKVDWKGSPAQHVVVAPGEAAHFECGGRGAAGTLLDLFKPSEAWIRLEPIGDP